jgi:UDP-N-acetylmuramate: L-alanyl-gamma-D-glutamyl-meso-diaminopimelate ligase
LAGEHNALNTLSLIPILFHWGLGPQVIATGISGFQGVHRRQEVRGVKAGVTVIDDFAHHPTAVRLTLQALRDQYLGRRLIAVFEPRTNTSRRSVFQSEYPRAFEGADRIIIREPPDLAKIPEKERFSSQKLVEDLRSLDRPADYFPDTEAILEFLQGELRSGDVVLIMSNGGFDNLHQRLLDNLEKEV